MSPWKILKSKTLFQRGFFKLRDDECELPDGRVMPNYYVIEFVDWVNVIPLTPDGQVILIRQHRHGAGKDFIEVPGGATHPGGQENPLKAAARELLEETGHEASEWIACGTHYPNPALQNNRMHTFVGLNCVKVADLNLDPFEDLEVLQMDLCEMLKLWRKGQIEHSLISASIGLSLQTLNDRGFKVF